MWRVLILALMTGVAACGIIDSARAQTAQPAPKAAPKEPAPKPAAPVANTTGKTVAKPESKPAAPHAAVAGGAEPTLIGQFGTWGAYSAAPNGKKVCFALAKPSSSKTNPPNRPRDPAYAFVSTRPAEKVNNEVSVMIGYALKPGSESSVEVGGAAFAMYSQGDGLWIKNAAEEERMVEAMRKSADLVVKGISSKGTETTDTFSLKGLAQALDRISQDCRR
ncbi:Invasion associated locus B family protein [Bradyrhizobium sp. 40]|jgi:Invasion associated locus B (IalB) protein|uniref:invasion associated locus B family protein n=1 Tax=Bradyrhizobium sp. 40 TaxID=2782674 RepID=UPI001FFE2F48|nr:invasion associated locus B family protein [Bradyrhizobium sp. 40]UPJ42594.1 Invasion associated locus B family protein [Bradyrhizobium sp. 40]